MTLIDIFFSLDEIPQRLQEIHFSMLDYGDNNPFPKNHDIQKSAAVLMPLVYWEGEWHLLFTRRTDSVEDHKGQVSFPGGAVDPTDRDIIDTALRETYEEIGIKPEDVKILGSLKPRELVSGFFVTPIIGVIPYPYPFSLSVNEVARIFTISLSWLADEENRFMKPHTFMGQEFQVLYYRTYDTEVLWGASASMTLELLDILSRK